MAQTLTVPRSFGGTLLITSTPVVLPTQYAVVTTTMRDGRVQVMMRDGRVHTKVRA